MDQTNFPEIIQKLRSRMNDAIRLGVGTENPAEFSMTMLIQLLNECERLRQDCLRQVQSYRELAKGAEHQSAAYGQVHSIVWAIYNGMVSGEERAIREQQEKEASDKAERERELEEIAEANKAITPEELAVSRGETEDFVMPTPEPVATFTTKKKHR